MKSNSNIIKGFLLIALGVAAGIGYFTFQGSGNLASQQPNLEAYLGGNFPPFLIFDSKASPDKGCYDLKWNSINATGCTSNWRPTIVTNGAEKLCQGKVDVDGVRIVDPKVTTTYSITCTGPAGSVSKSIKVK